MCLMGRTRVHEGVEIDAVVISTLLCGLGASRFLAPWDPPTEERSDIQFFRGCLDKEPGCDWMTLMLISFKCEVVLKDKVTVRHRPFFDPNLTKSLTI